jgi:hypothetical protein
MDGAITFHRSPDDSHRNLRVETDQPLNPDPAAIGILVDVTPFGAGSGNTRCAELDGVARTIELVPVV